MVHEGCVVHLELSGLERAWLVLWSNRRVRGRSLGHRESWCGLRR